MMYSHVYQFSDSSLFPTVKVDIVQSRTTIPGQPCGRQIDRTLVTCRTKENNVVLERTGMACSTQVTVGRHPWRPSVVVVWVGGWEGAGRLCATVEALSCEVWGGGVLGLCPRGLGGRRRREKVGEVG